MDERRFYVSGFQNKQGRFKITKIILSKETSGLYFIEMGKNGTNYWPENTAWPLRFTDNQSKPMCINDIYHIMEGK